MCQPKSEGGKRCLAHAAGTKATVRYTIAKTGANADMVKDTLKELNREGKHLPAPSEADVKELFDRTKFAAEHDPDLEQKDRNNIVKNVEKAQEEAERQGVTGGAFHAWKNLMRRVADKMKRVAKTAGIFGVVGLALAGCGTGEPQPTPTNGTGTEPGTSQSADPSASPLQDSNPDDHFIPLEEVTDEYGTYIRLDVDPNSPLFQLNDAVVDDASLEANGISREQALEAQQALAQYVVQDLLDSPRLDNYTQTHEEWIAEHQDLFSSEALEGIRERGPVLSGMVISDYLPTPINRNGDARGQMNIEVTNVQAYRGEVTGEPRVSVSFTYTSEYQTTDAVMREALARNTGQPAENFSNVAPSLFDGDDSSTLMISGTIQYGYDPVAKQIVGATGSWSPYEAESGMELNSGELPEIIQEG